MINPTRNYYPTQKMSSLAVFEEYFVKYMMKHYQKLLDGCALPVTYTEDQSKESNVDPAYVFLASPK